MKTGQKQAVKQADADEVKLQAVKLTHAKTPDADEVKLQAVKLTHAKTPDADEVKLQSMKTGQKQAVKQADADEVKLQSMGEERPSRDRFIGVVVFDPTKEEYRNIP
jgi:hypothetical protein